MKKLGITVFMLALASVFLFGCKKAPEDQLMGHMEAMVKILEDNAKAPADAAKKIEEYAKANGEAMKALMTELKGLEKKLSKEENEKRQKAAEAKFKGVQERIEKVMKANPELATNEAVQKAMGKLFGGM